MKRRLFRACVPVLLVPLLTSCLSSTRQTFGLDSGVPASAGALALGDGLIGRDRRQTLSADARNRALDAEYQALQFMPAGQAVAWEAGGLKGTVVPTQLYRVGSQDCRGYSQSVVRDGRETRTLGTACRGEDGFWKPVA